MIRNDYERVRNQIENTSSRTELEELEEEIGQLIWAMQLDRSESESLFRQLRNKQKENKLNE